MLYYRTSWSASVLLLLGSALVFSACALLEPARDEAPEPVAEEAVIVLAEYEEFDVAQYEENEPVLRVEVEHAVPSQLMEGRVGAGAERTVQGYRVQIYSTESRQAADERFREVSEWWEREWERGTLDAIYNGAAPEEAPVYLVYRQPYWRIRVGDFVEAEQARALRDILGRNFTGAFVAQSPVTVVR